MIDNLQSFFSDINYDYADVIQTQRAHLVLRLIQIIGVMSILASLTLLVITLITGAFIGPTQLIGFAIAIVGVLLIALLQNGLERLASILLIIMLFGASLPNIGVGLLVNNNITFIIPVIISALLFTWRGVGIVWLVASNLVIRDATNEIATIDVESSSAIIINTALTLLVLTLTAIILTYFVNRAQQQSTKFEQDALRIRRISRVASTLSNLTNEAEIIATTLNIIRTQLNYAHTNYYRVNASYEITQRIREGVNRLPEDVSISDSNAIAEALRVRKPVVVTLSSDITRRRHFEPGTVAAIAIPIQDDEESDVIGMLDIQSNNIDRLTTIEEVNTLQALASLVYGIIKQARVMTDLRDDLNEQQRIITTQRDRLRSITDRTDQVISNVWNDYIEARQRGESIGYDMQADHNTFTMAVDLPDEIRATIENGEIIVAPDPHEPSRQKISIPIVLREQVIGAMSFRLSPHRIANKRQIELMQNVVQRLGSALENQRLVEQSQTQAQRESRANEIGNVLLGTTDIESLLSIAADRFNQAMGAIQTQIQLQPTALERALTDETGDSTS